MIQKINDDLFVECEVWNRGNNAWGHKGRVQYKNEYVAEKSIRYYNRTWEAYQFDTLKECLMDKLDEQKIVPLKDRIEFAKFIKRN